MQTVLLKLNVKQSSLDKGLYYFFECNELSGILVVHVDDILFGGNSVFLKNVIEPLSAEFMFGAEHYGALRVLRCATHPKR